MSQFRPELRPVAPAALPLTDPERAWSLVLEHAPELPGWPRLPRRSFLESPAIQLCEGFPGVIFERDHIYVDEVWQRDTLLDKLYIAYLADDFTYGEISPEYAACLGILASNIQNAHPTNGSLWSAIAPGNKLPAPLAIKGQISGPLSWGAEVCDRQGRPILYNEELMDIVAKHLRLKAGWQERVLRQVAPASLMILEEPLLTVSSVDTLPFDRNRCESLMCDVLSGLTGLRGVACTYPVADIVLNLPADVLSVDVSSLPEPDPQGLQVVRTFVERGGFMIWAIVPAGGESADAVPGIAELTARLLAWLAAVAPDEEQRTRLAAASMVTVGGNLAGVEEQQAAQVLALTAQLSHAMRTACGFEK